MAGGMVQVADCLLRKHDHLSLNPVPPKEKVYKSTRIVFTVL
jgi:hypothetical protein